MTGVGTIETLRHIPEPTKLAVRLFQDYVRSSDFQVFNAEDHSGYFRQLMVRTAPDPSMRVVGTHPQDLSPDKLAAFKASLVSFFTQGAGKDAKITSLYYQSITKKCVPIVLIFAKWLINLVVESPERLQRALSTCGATHTFVSRYWDSNSKCRLRLFSKLTQKGPRFYISR